VCIRGDERQKKKKRSENPPFRRFTTSRSRAGGPGPPSSTPSPAITTQQLRRPRRPPGTGGACRARVCTYPLEQALTIPKAGHRRTRANRKDMTTMRHHVPYCTKPGSDIEGRSRAENRSRIRHENHGLQGAAAHWAAKQLAAPRRRRVRNGAQAAMTSPRARGEHPESRPIVPNPPGRLFARPDFLVHEQVCGPPIPNEWIHAPASQHHERRTRSPVRSETRTGCF